MTTREEWLALAERCAKAEGPGLILEQDIGLAAGVRMSLIPPYTASLDAITGLIDAANLGWEVDDNGRAVVGVESFSNGASPALALCVAFCREMAGKVK